MTDEINMPKVNLGKSNDPDRYKKGLRWALVLIVLMFIVIAVKFAIPGSKISYDKGYVDGWNGCVEKQGELLEQAGLRPEMNLTIETDEVQGENIGIIS